MFKPSLLLFIIFSFTTYAQQGFLEFNLDSSEVLQKGRLIEIDKLSLETYCPTSLSELIKLYPKRTTKYDVVLGMFTIWTEFINEKDKVCLVKHIKKDNFNTLKPNLGFYQILTVLESRNLLDSAEGKEFKAMGLSNEEYWEKTGEIYKYYDNISTDHIRKYGGANAVHKYIRNSKNKEEFENVLKQISQSDGNLEHIIRISMNTLLLQYFEKVYSAQQRQELIDIVNNRTYTKNDLILLENYWNLISYHIKDSENKKVLEKSKYQLRFDKITLAFTGKIDCNNFIGRFNLKGSNLKLSLGLMTNSGCIHFPWKHTTIYSKKLGKEITSGKSNSKEHLYRKQTDTIKKLLSNTMSYKIENSQLILSSEDSSKLIFE